MTAQNEKRQLEIGIVSDEISRDMREAFEIGRSWGINLYELREGSERRLPALMSEEVQFVDDQIRDGVRITALSPGIFKHHLHDEKKLDTEVDRILPRTIELAERFRCPLIVVFGFEKTDDEPQVYRSRALRYMERAGRAAADAGKEIIIENEPNFWFDRVEDVSSLLEELDMPNVRANWDPANAFWGGEEISYERFQIIKPYIRNLHIKDYDGKDEKAPWKPVGEGAIPWPEIIHWVAAETDLEHVTVETHVFPLIPASEKSVENVRRMISDARS